MEEDLFETQWHRKTKWLTQALILSGALNLGLIATFIYFAVRSQPSYEPISAFPEESVRHFKEKFSQTNAEILSKFFTCSFPELLAQLQNRAQIEEGYAIRDLALSCLVSFHYFDLEKALSGYQVQKRYVKFVNQDGGEKIGITLFPGLSDNHFRALLLFAQREKWPFSSQGLFYEMKNHQELITSSLRDAFYLTSEYQSIFTLLNRTDMLSEKETVLKMLLEGPWDLVEEVCGNLITGQNFTAELTRECLVKFFDQGSSIAATLLVEKEKEYALKYLTDTQLSSLVELYTGDQKESLARALKKSVRSDLVRNKAGEVLQEEPALVKVQEVTPQKNLYIVQSGDTLWKISRTHKVKVSEIKKHNHLKSEVLKPGMRLEIP